ncbi:putative actin patch assembly and actin polymerization protein [Actinomortierella ambigua]|nr:putative actin patch assembly and actin polymerization protein [Actinomortierella ambigua]
MGLFTKQTQITTSIEVITGQKVISDWSAVALLCEQVNAKDDGAKEAAKALRKKLRQGRPQQQMNAISVIQAMINGCGSKFKAQVSCAKFAEDIEAVAVSESTDVNVKIQLMESLEEWAAVFSTEPGLTIIPQLYNSLIRTNTPRRRNDSPNANSPPQTRLMTPEQRMRQMSQDIELARNNAHMLTEAVSFCDPDTEAIEENELIKEFYAKCITLQRGIQHYLSEMTESANPDEEWLTSLLACNQELVQAFTVYNQMMERQQLQRITRASAIATGVVPTASGTTAVEGKRRSPSPEHVGGAYAGVGGGAAGAGYALSNGHSNGQQTASPTTTITTTTTAATTTTTATPQSYQSRAQTPPTQPYHQQHSQHQQAQVVPSSQHDVAVADENPFADEPYYVTGPPAPTTTTTTKTNDPVSAAVKMGKRTDNQDKVFDASAYFRQQQLEQAQIQLVKEEQDRLQREAEGYMGSSQSGSSTSTAALAAGTSPTTTAAPSASHA